MHRLTLRPALVLGLLSALLTVPPLPGRQGVALAQAVRYVSGTGVGLVPPKGMVPAKAFSGFESPGTNASILVAEFPPEAYPQILATFNPEGITASGLQAAGPAIDWKVAGGQGGRLIRGKQAAHGLQFKKWIMLAKSSTNTVMLSVQVPEAKDAPLTDAAVEAALRTVSLKAAPTLEEQVGALPFKVGDRVNFRLVRVLAGSGLLLTDGPRDTIPDASQPVVIVASALGTVDAGDEESRRALAQQAFATIAGVSDVSIVSQTMTEKDGVAWSRIEGRGTYRDSMEAVGTLQVMRFDKAGYVRVVAIARTLVKDNVFPRVDTLAASITPK